MISTRFALTMLCLAGGIGLWCVGGCTPPSATNTPAAAPTTAPADASAPAPAAPAGISDRTVIIRVNERPILMEQLTELMLANYGIEAAEQLVATAVVQQEAAREGLTVTPADVAAENTETLKQVVPNLAPADQQRVLAQLLERRKISLFLWDQIMQRNALLRTIAEKRVKIDDELLLAEFNRRYGAKRQVRHIQCASLVDAQKVRDLLDKGQDFAKLAAELSTNKDSAAQGGLIAPFSQNDPGMPAAIVRVAFALQEGQVSEVVQVDKDFHILKLEKVLPPEQMRFEDVKAVMALQLHAAMVRQMQGQILQDLIRLADVQFVNPQLKEQAQAKAQAAQGP